MMDYFVVDVTQYVFITDSTEFDQPMTYYVEHPIDIDFHFNSIAYSKGLFASYIDLNQIKITKLFKTAAAVLRMFWMTFGENTFMRGMTQYLEDKYKYFPY